MAKIEELRAAYGQYRDEIQRRGDEAVFFASALVNGFREYVGLPPTFSVPTRDHEQLRQYIRWYKLDEADEYEEAHGPRDAVGYFRDGSFDFGFGIALERAENAHPKELFRMKVKGRRDDDLVHFDISGTEVVCTFDGEKLVDIEKAHATIFEKIMDFLLNEPSRRKLPRMGFGFATGS